MNSDFSFRLALVASCLFLILGYVLLQVRLHSEDIIQIQALPLTLPVASEPGTTN